MTGDKEPYTHSIVSDICTSEEEESACSAQGWGPPVQWSQESWDKLFRAEEQIRRARIDQGQHKLFYSPAFPHPMIRRARDFAIIFRNEGIANMIMDKVEGRPFRAAVTTLVAIDQTCEVGRTLWKESRLEVLALLLATTVLRARNRWCCDVYD